MVASLVAALAWTLVSLVARDLTASSRASPGP
jgi:hypothetical protein